MFNRMFQSVIHQMKDAVGRVIGIIDKNDIVVACSDLQHIGEVRQGIREELAFKPEGLVSGGVTYRSVPGSTKPDLVVFVEGADKSAEQAAAILAISIGNMKSLYDQKYDKASFIKNVMLDNILPSDIYIKSKELHFNTEESRIVFLIKFYGKTDMMPFEMLQNMFPDKSKDYVISVGEHDIVLVKDVKPGTENKEFEKIAIVSSGGEAWPCGICRQFMKEFCDDDFVIITGNDVDSIRTYTLAELLPEGFRL